MLTENLLIDGNNLLYKVPETQAFMPDKFDIARQKLEQLVRSRFGGQKTTIKIIFDGHSPEHFHQRGRIQSTFANGDGNADRALIAFLRRQTNRKRWTVVSSDNEVRMRASNLDAQVISSDEFSARLRSSKKAGNVPLHKSDPHLSRNEIDEWMALFSTEED